MIQCLGALTTGFFIFFPADLSIFQDLIAEKWNLFGRSFHIIWLLLPHCAMLLSYIFLLMGMTAYGHASADPRALFACKFTYQTADHHICHASSNHCYIRAPACWPQISYQYILGQPPPGMRVQRSGRWPVHPQHNYNSYIC